MSRRLLDYDPASGVTNWHVFDSATDTTTIETTQDVTPFIERNKARQNDAEYSRLGMKEEMWHVATIPAGVQEKWLTEDGINIYNKDHWPAIRRKLMDPDYRYLRTSLGNI